MKKVLNALAWVAIIGNLCFIFLIAWWLIHPYRLPKLKQPIQILNENKTIAIGDPIKMNLIVEKDREMKPTSIVRNITCNDGNLVTMAGDIVDLPKGNYTVASDRFILPPKVAKGSVCQFNFTNTYKLNPIRSQTTTYSSEQFKVKE